MSIPADAVPKLLLLVDDDDDIREVAATALELVHGFRVVTANGGLTGLQQARLHQPDGILMDVMMPGMDGLETAKCLKADPATVSIPVILLTARVDGDEPEENVAGVISKPFDPMTLGAEVRRVLGWSS